MREADKMKLVMHHGRTGLAKHNDRSGRAGEHIKTERTPENRKWQVHPELTFEQEERLFYREHFTEWLEERNERARAARHPERVKDVGDLLKGRQTRPEEVILQVGDVDSHIDADKLWEAARRLIATLEYKYPLMRSLDYAMHLDEATPHLHWRRVWTYHDDAGHLAIGQEKALQELGVPLPHPDQAPSRYNNRKMTFTADARETWLDICRDLGISIDTTPCGHKHMTTMQYQLRKTQERLQKAQHDLQGTELKLEDATSRYEALSNACEDMQERLKPALEAERQYSFLKDDPEVCEAVSHALYRMRELDEDELEI